MLARNKRGRRGTIRAVPIALGGAAILVACGVEGPLEKVEQLGKVASADTTLTPTKDAYISQASSSTNYGTSSLLDLELNANNDKNVWISFSLAGLSNITSAKLELYVNTAPSSNQTADVYYAPTLSDTWSESSLKWGSPPPAPGVDPSSGKIATQTVTSSSSGYVIWDVTSAVATDTDGVATFVLDVSSSPDGSIFKFNSNNASSNKPQLIITTGSSCTPTTCSAQGKNCGSISDGCSGSLNCGSCTSPQTCGGGGTPNVCGCTPTTCSAQGKNCGSISDNCGGTISSCGTCTSPATCGGAGTANVCGTVSCTPTTCGAQAKNCGSIPDGCGGTLNCGSCTSPATCGGGGTSNVCGGGTTFTHPGVVNTTATLNFVKAKIQAGAQPWTAAYNAAKADTYGSLSYVDHPPTDTNGNVDCGSFSSPDIHCHDQRDDATAAYTDALLWYFSGNQAYATLGTKILNDWASALVSMTDVNNVVQAGWVGGLYAEAGEIFANTSSGWTTTQISAFKSMLTNILVPLNQYGQAGQNGNHETQNANAMVQLGVFLDNQSVYNTGISLWNGRITNYIYMTSDGAEPNSPTNCTSSNWWCTNEGSAAAITTPVGCCKNNSGYNSAGSGWCNPSATGFPTACDQWGYWGQAATSLNHTNLVNGIVQEICRDFEHSTEGINSLNEAAETARIQGNPGLFTNNAARLAAGMELLAQYLNQAGHNNTNATISGPSWLCGGTLTMLGGSNTSPVPGWEIGYNEFVNREGLAMPNTLALINANRPMGYDGTRQSAWETLTHAGVGYGTACTPATACPGGQTCGTASDGCGGTLTCGTCGSGYSCNGTTCVSTCTPKTCAQLGFTCGSASDGCGGTLTCGTCGSGQTCTSSQTCCTLATCAGLGDTCGMPSDTCGGALNCGTCTSPQYCGGGGTTYQCANDTVAPSVPTALSATNVTTTTVALQWNASTDSVGVTGYKIYQGGTQIATSTSTSYNVTGLTAGTAYSYTVAAYDAAGNTSAQSTALNVTTTALDTTAPSVPTGLASTNVTSTGVTLNWTASTDNVGVSGYNVYRGGTKIGISATTTYADSGLTANTAYSYTVAAYDAAGNTSAQSSTLNVTTASASSNIAPSGTGYTWYGMTSSSATTHQTAAIQVNDNSTSTQVNIDSSNGDSANAWEGGGVTFSSTHTVTSVVFVNGNAQPDSTTDGWFTANIKLQFSTDGTTWTDSTWTVSPAYPYTSAAYNHAYTFSGTQQTGIKGVRVVGQVRTTDTSWWCSVAEVQVIGN